jgi:LmbE family N-acetylglucosaminyl deacetylase
MTVPTLLVVVAHPDDETLWCGGELMGRPERSTYVITLCRGSDAERAPRFQRALAELGVQGAMGDLDDGPEQDALDIDTVKRRSFDLVLTHHADGEYRRHRRHEECSRAIAMLREEGALRAGSLWQFAYENDEPGGLTRARRKADWLCELRSDIFAKKRRIITDIYGFRPDSWEAQTTPAVEAFMCCPFSAR